MDAGGQARKRPLDAGGPGSSRGDTAPPHTPVSPPGKLLITCRSGASVSPPDLLAKGREAMRKALRLLDPFVTEVVVRVYHPERSPVDQSFSCGGERSGDRTPSAIGVTEKLDAVVKVEEALMAWDMLDTRCLVSWCTCDAPAEDCVCQDDDEDLVLNLLGAQCHADVPGATERKWLRETYGLAWWDVEDEVWEMRVHEARAGNEASSGDTDEDTDEDADESDGEEPEEGADGVWACGTCHRRYRPDTICCRECEGPWADIECDCELGLRHTVLGQVCDCHRPHPPAYRPDLRPRLAQRARDTAPFWIAKSLPTPNPKRPRR